MPRSTKPTQPKLIREIYRDARYAGPGLQVGACEWWEEIGGVTSDANLLQLARGAVENYTAAWLIYFTTGHLVGLWKPPTVVLALGLDYATDRKRERVWQVEGTALVEAVRMTETVADVASQMVTDYRVEGARVMRNSSAACERARVWCDAYERKQAQQGRYDRPPEGMPSPATLNPRSKEATARILVEAESDALRYYYERVQAAMSTS